MPFRLESFTWIHILLHSKQLLILVPDCFEYENNDSVCFEMKYVWILREGLFYPFSHSIYKIYVYIYRDIYK